MTYQILSKSLVATKRLTGEMDMEAPMPKEPIWKGKETSSLLFKGCGFYRNTKLDLPKSNGSINCSTSLWETPVSMKIVVDLTLKSKQPDFLVIQVINIRGVICRNDESDIQFWADCDTPEKRVQVMKGPWLDWITYEAGRILEFRKTLRAYQVSQIRWEAHEEGGGTASAG